MSKTAELSPPEGLLLIVNYNQAEEIAAFLGEVERCFAKSRCLIVDDGSTDGSPEIAERRGFRVLRHPGNHGVGAAIRSGLRYAEANGFTWVIISAANGKMRPNEFARVYGPVARNEADYVQGSRYLDSGSSPGLPLFRRLAIPAFTLFASLILGRRFTDITCGLRSYRLTLARDPQINLDQGWLDHYELEYYLHYRTVRSHRYRVTEVPVTMKYDHVSGARRSKIRPLTGWWSMIRPFVLLGLRIKK